MATGYFGQNKEDSHITVNTNVNGPSGTRALVQLEVRPELTMPVPRLLLCQPFVRK
jgi:hypothetical protein